MQVRPQESNRSREFAAFMQLHQDQVYSTASRLTGNDAQAQDIAQEVFIKAYEHFEQLRDSATAIGWLRTVARNMSLNYLSRYRRRWRFFSEVVAREDDEEDAPVIDVAVPDTLFEDLAAAQRHEIVERSLAWLPTSQRVALVLYHFEELSYVQISQALHISLAKVKTDILRGRVRLAALLVTAAAAESL